MCFRSTLLSHLYFLISHFDLILFVSPSCVSRLWSKTRAKSLRNTIRRVAHSSEVTSSVATNHELRPEEDLPALTKRCRRHVRKIRVSYLEINVRTKMFTLSDWILKFPSHMISTEEAPTGQSRRLPHHRSPGFFGSLSSEGGTGACLSTVGARSRVSGNP